MTSHGRVGLGPTDHGCLAPSSVLEHVTRAGGSYLANGCSYIPLLNYAYVENYLTLGNYCVSIFVYEYHEHYF